MFENEVMNSKVGGNFALPPAENHLARICAIISIGTVDNEFVAEGGKTVTKHEKKIRLGFELVNTSHVFDSDRGAEPFVAWTEITDSLNPKSNLGKMLKAWLWSKKEVTKEEMEAFNLVSLLGKEECMGAKCMVNITHGTSKKGNDKYDIAGVTPAPTGVEVPKGKVKQVLFNFNPPFKAEVFKTLPKFVQDKIRTSDEYKKIVGNSDPAVSAGAPAQQAGKIEKPEDDDLPF